MNHRELQEFAKSHLPIMLPPAQRESLYVSVSTTRQGTGRNTETIPYIFIQTGRGYSETISLRIYFPDRYMEMRPREVMDCFKSAIEAWIAAPERRTTVYHEIFHRVATSWRGNDRLSQYPKQSELAQSYKIS